MLNTILHNLLIFHDWWIPLTSLNFKLQNYIIVQGKVVGQANHLRWCPTPLRFSLLIDSKDLHKMIMKFRGSHVSEKYPTTINLVFQRKKIRCRFLVQNDSLKWTIYDKYTKFNAEENWALPNVVCSKQVHGVGNKTSQTHPISGEWLEVWKRY